MNKSKDKRIKKLKKARIWPSIVGMIILFFVFWISVVAMLGVGCFDVVQRKVADGRSESVKIAKLYENIDSDELQSINDKVSNYLDMSSKIKEIYVLDNDGNEVWKSGQLSPNMDEAHKISFIKDSEDTRIIIEEDEHNAFNFDEEGYIEFNENIITKINFSDVLGSGAFMTNDESKAVMQLKVWFVINVEGSQVCVLNNIYVYSSDVFMLVVSAAIFVMLIIVFMVYYLVSFIGLILNVNRTAKIIYTDVVTGGNNWLYFVKKGTSLLKRNKKHNYAMLHIEMRKYMSYCTCFGVREGEELIEKFYHIMKKHISRKEAMAHRENADFGLLLTYTDSTQLVERINQLETAMNTVLPDMQFYFGVGVYVVAQGEKDIEQLYNNALLAGEMLNDEAENQIAFFDIEMNKQKIWERKVEDDMYRALENREFKVYLQPKIDAKNESLAGAEALVRWIHPTEGFIPPNKFIPIFEKNGFILKLDDYMLREIARQQAQWLLEGRQIVPVSVNISRAHFTRDDLAEHISGIVDKFQVPHNMIELELTESAFFDDKYVLLNTVKKLRDAGFIVSMDDFGAGYSSLNSLKELNIDVLKIDADFFRGVDSVERGKLIVSEVIDLAKKLNMKIVAEGIESREQVDFLVEQECDLIQGYFFAKPMPIDEFVEKYN